VATRVVFESTTEVVVLNLHPADLARQIAGETGANWAGRFLYVDVKDGDSVWINPTTIAYLERVDD
jgi:hypothetical protein